MPGRIFITKFVMLSFDNLSFGREVSAVNLMMGKEKILPSFCCSRNNFKVTLAKQYLRSGGEFMSWELSQGIHSLLCIEGLLGRNSQP